MGPPSYMQSVIDWNIVMWHMTVLTLEWETADHKMYEKMRHLMHGKQTFCNYKETNIIYNK